MNFAMPTEIANLAMGLRNSQWVCEFRNGFAKFAMWFANFAMRNFAKLLAMGLRNAQYPAATVPLLTASCCLHPASTASHFLHFSFDFPLIFGLVDG